MSWFCEKQSINSKFCIKVKRVLEKRKSKFNDCVLYETFDQGKLLVMDNTIMLIENLEFPYHEMIAHIPLFSCKNAKKILIIGGGDGATLRECLKHDLKEIHVCEIDEEVINICKKHFAWSLKSFNNKRVSIIINDAQQYLRETNEKYDLIIADIMDAVGECKKLYSTDFYNLIKKHLNFGGLFCSIGTTPFSEKALFKKTEKNLRKIFANVSTFLAYVPMYQSGCWSFFLASQKVIPQPKKPRIIRGVKAMKNRYYNFEVHKAAFALPEFIGW